MSHDLSALKAHLERDGARFIPPFLLWLDGDEVMLGHVVRGAAASSGAMSPGEARDLAEALRDYARLAEEAPGD